MSVALFLLLVLASPAFAATMPSVQMTFVDAQNSSAIVGAVVLFQASAREGTWTGHGGRSASLFAVEGVTDATGAVQFPKQEFSAQPFFLNTNYENASMVALKPGYALLVLINQRGIPTEVRSVTTWEYNSQTITMKRSSGDAEIPDTVWHAATYADRALAGHSLCRWRNIPRFLVTLDRMAADWNRKRDALSDPALRVKSASSPVQRLFMNDALFVEKGCGSPKAFFESYLHGEMP